VADILALFLAYDDPGRRLARKPVNAFDLEAGKGIVGDRGFGRRKRRQVNILQARFYTWFAAAFGDKPAFGDAGENVVVSDEIDLNWVLPGQRFRLGTAVVRWQDFRTPCDVLAGALLGKEGSPSVFVGHVGILCDVVGGGSAKVGDTFEIEGR
jgi:MOSC domain-containing protein YiiM